MSFLKGTSRTGCSSMSRLSAAAVRRRLSSAVACCTGSSPRRTAFANLTAPRRVRGASPGDRRANPLGAISRGADDAKGEEDADFAALAEEVGTSSYGAGIGDADDAGFLPLYSTFSDALEDWQLVRLEEAFAMSGRHKISVLDLTQETMLSRGQVLDWMKMRRKMTEDQVETLRAVCLATLEREEQMEQGARRKASRREFAKLSIEERKERKAKRKDRMGAVAQRTLLKFWSQVSSQFPKALAMPRGGAMLCVGCAFACPTPTPPSTALHPSTEASR